MNLKQLEKANMEYKEPLCLWVKYELSNEFAMMVNSEPGCKVEKVIELLTCKMLEYCSLTVQKIKST